MPPTPSPISVAAFCDRHRACAEGHAWATSQGVATMRKLWRLPMRPQWRIWIATRPGVMPARDLRLFACWCACCTPLGDGRVSGALLTDPRSRNAIAVAIAHALGVATDARLAEARTAAYAAAAYAAAADAAAYAAYAAAAAAYAAADAAAAAAAADAATAAYAAADAARTAQAAHLLPLLPEFPL